jgi:predicted XRE-type DNA-binding protein
MTKYTRLSQKRFANAFEALFEPEEAANLVARAELRREIMAVIRRNRWSQSRAAEECGITQPRMNALFKNHIEKFSLDALFNIATALGRRVTIKVSAPRRAA